MYKSSQELGKFLRECRESLGFTIEDAAEQLSIRRNFIRAMEEGDFKDLPGLIYTEGHLKAYARFLKLDPEEVLEDFRAATREVPEDAVGEFVARGDFSNEMRPTPQLVGIAMVAALFFYTVWYQFQDFGADEALAGHIENIKPLSGQVEDSSIVLLAVGDVHVTVFRATEIFSAFMMQAGDTYFVPDQEGLSMKISDDTAVDMFVDGDEIKNLQALKKETGVIKLDIWELLSHKRNTS